MTQLSLISTVTPNSEPLLEGYPISYCPNFLAKHEADRLFHQSLSLQWQRNQITMLGKTIPLPRDEAIFGDSDRIQYQYSGVILRAKRWPVFLQDLRVRIHLKTQLLFAFAVGNCYRSGQDSMGYHADDESMLGERPAIASISLGGTRTFRIKANGASHSVGLELTHGSLLMMYPGCQEQFKHAVPKTKKDCGVRINWTFRPWVEA